MRADQGCVQVQHQGASGPAHRRAPTPARGPASADHNAATPRGVDSDLLDDPSGGRCRETAPNNPLWSREPVDRSGRPRPSAGSTTRWSQHRAAVVVSVAACRGVSDDFESGGCWCLHRQGDPSGWGWECQAVTSSLVGESPSPLAPACTAATRNSWVSGTWCHYSQYCHFYGHESDGLLMAAWSPDGRRWSLGWSCDHPSPACQLRYGAAGGPTKHGDACLPRSR